MQPASAQDTSDTRSSLRKWGPVAAIAVAALVVVGIIVVGGGDDDGDVADPTTTPAPTAAPSDDDGDDGADDSPDGDAGGADETDEGAGGDADDAGDGGAAGDDADAAEIPDVDADGIPVVLTFSEAEELGVEIDWGDRCDTSTGRIAVPDFFAPECFRPFSGDNGGATDVGVTADSIRVVYYLGPEADPIIRYITDAIANDDTNDDSIDTMLGLNAYFEAFYETYGRSVELVPFVSTGIASDEVAARADAVRIAEDIQPFMVLGGPALTSAFADELAARGVLCLSCSPSQPQDWYADRWPYVWAIDASAGQKLAHAAEFIVAQLAGGNAEFAGDPAFRDQPRTYGLVFLESSATSVQQADRFEADLAAGGITLAERVAYALDPATIQQSASQTIARLKAAGVTTVLYSGDPIAPRDFTAEATAQDYFPEWVLAAPSLNDTNAFARTYDQQQWATAFGVTSLSLRLEPSNSGYFRLYEWFNGEEPPAADSIGVIGPLPGVMYAMFQEVGPNLTRERWALALMDGESTTPAITQPSLNWGETPFWPYVDHHGIDDATLIFWDPDEVGPDEIRREGAGMWRFVDGGQRYLPGTWPSSSGLFDRDTSIAILAEPPPEEAPPDYPAP